MRLMLKSLMAVKVQPEIRVHKLGPLSGVKERDSKISGNLPWAKWIVEGSTSLQFPKVGASVLLRVSTICRMKITPPGMYHHPDLCNQAILYNPWRKRQGKIRTGNSILRRKLKNITKIRTSKEELQSCQTPRISFGRKYWTFALSSQENTKFCPCISTSL